MRYRVRRGEADTIVLPLNDFTLLTDDRDFAPLVAEVAMDNWLR